MKDIVIPYKKNNSGELEVCLQLIKKNFPHRNIHVVEHEGIFPYRYAPHVDVIMKLKWAIYNLDLTDDFYLWNDDFFILQPVKEIEYFHKGTLQEHINKRVYKDSYYRALSNTFTHLYSQDSLSYELHIPFKFNKNLLSQLIEQIKPETNKNCPLIRSSYGNFFKVGGEYTEDVKNIPDFKNKTFLSTTERSFKNEPIGEYIRSKLE